MGKSASLKDQESAKKIIREVRTEIIITTLLTFFTAANNLIRKRSGTSRRRIMEDIPNTVEILSSSTLKGSKLMFEAKISLLKTECNKVSKTAPAESRRVKIK